MEITKEYIEGLLHDASLNPRHRLNVDLRNSNEDNSQRMLNALLPDTKVDIHRHAISSESVFCIYGKLDEIIFDDKGNEIQRIHLSPNEGRFGCQIPKGAWHTVEVFEPSVIVEFKDGKYGHDFSEKFEVQ